MAPTTAPWDDDMIVRRHSDVFAADGDGDIVVLDTEHGAFLHLNRTASCIFALLDAPLSVAALRDRLVASFEVDPETCRADLGSFLADLVARGLVEVGPGG